jgi:hypothetical protein
MAFPLIAAAAAGSSLLSGLGGILGGGAQKKQTKDMIRDYDAVQAQSEAALGGARDATLGYYQPYAQGGQQAFQGAQNMLQPGYQFSPTDPSYSFRFNEGMNALTRQQSAAGGLQSGGAMKAAMRYGQGLASTEYGNQFNRFNQLAQYGLQSAQGMGQAQQNYGNVLSGMLLRAADGRSEARGLRGEAIKSQWDSATSGVTGAIGSFFGF